MEASGGQVADAWLSARNEQSDIEDVVGAAGGADEHGDR